MAKSEKDPSGRGSVESMLRSLTDRPNVESALILSRRDGSIIKDAGFASTERRRRAESTAAYRPSADTKSDDAKPQGSVAIQESDEQAVQGEHEDTSPAQELAAAVFQFVRAAGAMGSTLWDISTDKDVDDGAAVKTARSRSEKVNGSANEANDEQIASSEESQVQLLRLRIKHREVIIFPDPYYLCCVVQRVGKSLDVR